MLAFVFPGQGAQRVGMGAALAKRYPVAKQVFDEADQALAFPLSKLCFEGPDQELELTANAQPAILTTSIAILRVLEQETPLRPAMVAGHSLGEYSALVSAGALELADAVRTVRKRGEFMQAAVPAGQGSMAAVMGVSVAEVEAICDEAAQGRVLCAANFNAPGQTVIAGHADAVQRAVKLAEAKGAMAKELKVSAPFHCPLMAPAATELARVLKGVKFRAPAVPLVSNVDAEPSQEAAAIAERLVRQVTAPVRWEASVRRLVELGVRELWEIGAGKTLTGLARRIDKTLKLRNVEEPADIDALKSLGAPAKPTTAPPRDATWAHAKNGARVKTDGSLIVWPDGREEKLNGKDWRPGVNGALLHQDGTWIIWPTGEAQHFGQDEWLVAQDGSKYRRDGLQVILPNGYVRDYDETFWIRAADGLRLRRDARLVIWPDGNMEELVDAVWDTRRDGSRVKKDRTRIITCDGVVEHYNPDEWQVDADGTWRRKDGARIIWPDGMVWDRDQPSAQG